MPRDPMNDPLYLGLDLGTSGARALVIDGRGAVVAQAKALMADFGSNLRDPAVWWQAASAALTDALREVEAARVCAVAVDGTSGTMLAVDAQGRPLGDALMYNDSCTDAAILADIARHAPRESAALGASSALARAIALQSLQPHRILHQADWIAFRLSGRMVSDANNALKTGYDPVAGAWPEWIGRTLMQPDLLPEVIEPGAVAGAVIAPEFGLTDCRMIAGTTDGCASFLATGAAQVGSGVSALGTTLTLKILSDKPIFAPEFGIYSHRLLGMWLAGGASNSGGAALLTHFSTEELRDMTPLLRPDQPTGLDYYPLPARGERFPIADPMMEPRLTPQPAEPEVFLQGLLEGIAATEALGFSRLQELGAPKLSSLRSVGGGAQNAAWSRIRQRVLGVEFVTPRSDEAAYGAALLAQRGAV